ncbi:uncharacterized protein B0P05DRAFT_465515, partial [Gilbertella persicaria]|uniref:uncharacterized protein n=1 Tax=Gilbertella persicaria TaxID=101096 RepID=UPI00221F52EC
SKEYITLELFSCFFKTLAFACKETLSVSKELKQEHKTVLRSGENNSQNLLQVINPVVIRLNEGNHINVIAEHGPLSPIRG